MRCALRLHRVKGSVPRETEASAPREGPGVRAATRSGSGSSWAPGGAEPCFSKLFGVRGWGVARPHFALPGGRFSSAGGSSSRGGVGLVALVSYGSFCCSLRRPPEDWIPSSVAEAPAVRGWFGPDGNKLHTAAWQRYGFDSPAIRNEAAWVFHTQPQHSHHLANYPLTPEHREWLGRHFDDLLASGQTEQYDSRIHGSEADFAAVINPLFVVVKDGTSLRPIIDPSRSGVNECMTRLPCPLPDLNTILQHLPSDGFLGKRDLASGFHHVKLGPEARRFMAFRHPVSGALQRWVVLPFGASQSPPIFVELTTAGCAIFQAECDRRGLRVRLFVYVDDFIMLGASHADVVGAFEVLDQLGSELGLEWKTSKDRGRDVPLQQLDFLGMLFDTVALEMRISPDKRSRYASDVSGLLGEAATGPISRRTLQAVAGKLTFIARACRWGASFIQAVYDDLFSTLPRPPATVSLSPAATEDLVFWVSLLRSDSSVWDGVKRCVVADLDWVRGEFLGTDGAVVFTDASGKGFGAAWEESEVQGEWGLEEGGLHVAWLELKAVLRALQSWAVALSGKRVLVRCDNTQAVAAITRGSTRITEGRPIARQIAALAIQFGFEIRAEHIRGVENGRADRLSRQLSSARDQNLQLKASIFRELCRGEGFSPSVDCCCDPRGSNAQPGCGVFFSAVNSVLGKEAELAGRVLWAFPPQELVGEVLAVIDRAVVLDSRTRATVVVPDWRARAWHSWFVRRASSRFKVWRVLRSGRRVCLWPWGAEADPCPYDLLVLRIP